jgi:hypothetical protein
MMLVMWKTINEWLAGVWLRSQAAPVQEKNSKGVQCHSDATQGHLFVTKSEAVEKAERDHCCTGICKL